MIAGFRCAPGHSCGDGNAWWRSWVVIPNAGWYAVFGEGDRGLFIRVLAEGLAACCVMSVGLVWFGAGCNGGWLARLPVSRPGVCWGLVGSSVSLMGQWPRGWLRAAGHAIFFSLLVICVCAIFVGDTMYRFYLFVRAVGPVSHGAIMMFQLGLMVSVYVLYWS